MYFVYTLDEVGIQPSISKTFYKLEYPVIFRLFIFGVSVPILLFAANLSTGLMIAGSLITWVGFAPKTKGEDYKVERRNHFIGATTGIIAGFITFGVEFVNWSNYLRDEFFWAIVLFVLSAIVILPIGPKRGVKNHITWVEVFAFNIIILTLIISQL